jgi:hypothetical protein
MGLEGTPTTPAGRPAGVRKHPARQDLESFIRGELPRDEAPAIVRHLLTNCTRCLTVTRELWRPRQPAVEVAEVPGEETRPIRLAVSLRGRLLRFNGR